MTKTPVRVLELNNIDIYGKRFNGSSLQEYIRKHPEYGIEINFLVNHKLSADKNIAKLFESENLEIYDWKIEEIEQNLKIKNQISVAEEALIKHPLYQQADILHFHMYHNMHLPIEFLTRIPKEKQIILDFHDTFWLTDDDIPMLEVFQFSDVNKSSLDTQRKRVLNSIDAHFILHSPFMQKIAQKSSVTKHLDVSLINFGIDSEIFKPLDQKSLREKYNIPQDNLVLLCRSQKEFKGTPYINEAIKKLRTTKSITVITVGAKNLLDKSARYNLVELGSIDDEKKMTEIYNLCDIFLAPSTEESFGFMAIEAMSCEKPVIVFDGTALPYTVNAPKIGISTKRSSDELAKAIDSLANNPQEIIFRGQAGREYVLKNYTEQQYFNHYIALFQKLAKQQRNPLPTQAPDSPDQDTTKHFEAFLNQESETPELFDYNNPTIQNTLYKYNKKLYNEINKSTNPQNIKSLMKKLIPRKVKQYLKEKGLK